MAAIVYPDRPAHPPVYVKDAGTLYVESGFRTTSGGLADLWVDTMGTMSWSPLVEHVLSLPGRLGVVREKSARTESAFRESLAPEGTTDSAEMDFDMARLELAAENGDEGAFLRSYRAMDWRRRTAGHYLRAVQLALASGAHMAARSLSTEGVARFPNHAELVKYAHILAPPTVIRSDLPPRPDLKANRDWIMMHRQQFRGQWVALRHGKLLGVATTLQALRNQLREDEGAFYTKVW